MTSADYRATLAALGISQARLSRLLCVDKGTTTRWAYNTRVPEAVALLLRLMMNGTVPIEYLETITSEHVDAARERAQKALNKQPR
jgi:hypothetical protein